MQRTISNISAHFTPLENAIREKLIPALIGRKVTDSEHCILALPVRYGGIGLRNHMEQADDKYTASKRNTYNQT